MNDRSDHIAGASPPPRDGLHVHVDRADGQPVLWLHGELDLATAPRLGRALHAALDAKPAVLAVDLSKLGFVDSTGIRVLFEAGRRARADGCILVLRAPSRSVDKALRLTRIDLLVVVEDGPLTALARYPGPA